MKIKNDPEGCSATNNLAGGSDGAHPMLGRASFPVHMTLSLAGAAPQATLNPTEQYALTNINTMTNIDENFLIEQCTALNFNLEE
jgi:hypothetical protein